MSDIRLIIFDLSAVCYSNEEEDFLLAFCKEHNILLDDFVDDYMALCARAERDEISGKDVIRKTFEKYHLDLDIDEFLDSMMATKIRYEDTFAVVAQLRSSGYKVACLSNYSKDFYDCILNYFDVPKDFDYCLISYMVQARKPEEKGFATIMNHFGEAPMTTLFIDDSKKNVDAAASYNLRTIHLTNRPLLPSLLEKQGIVFK